MVLALTAAGTKNRRVLMDETGAIVARSCSDSPGQDQVGHQYPRGRLLRAA